MQSGRTMVFCTGHSTSLRYWETRYARWLVGIELSIEADVVVIIDDGSPILPHWPAVPVYNSIEALGSSSRFIYHFDSNLGRHGITDYPGWFRSFTFASTLAEVLKCSRVVHIESDAFVLSERLAAHLVTASGWTCPRSTRGQTPESGIQSIAPDAQLAFRDFATRPYDEFKGLVIEHMIPYTMVTSNFIGDRYGETLSAVPWAADWTMQTPEDVDGQLYLREDYYWFLSPERRANLDANPSVRARWVDWGREFVTQDGGLGRLVDSLGEPFWLGLTRDDTLVGPCDGPEACARRLMSEARLDATRSSTSMVSTSRVSGHRELTVVLASRDPPIACDVLVGGHVILSLTFELARGWSVNDRPAGPEFPALGRQNEVLLDELARLYFDEYEPGYRRKFEGVTWHLENYTDMPFSSRQYGLKEFAGAIVFERTPPHSEFQSTAALLLRVDSGRWQVRSGWGCARVLLEGANLRSVIDHVLSAKTLRPQSTLPRVRGPFNVLWPDSFVHSFPVGMHHLVD